MACEGFVMENPLPTLLEGPQFLTVEQAAGCLNVSPSCVYRLSVTNRLTHYKFGEGRGALWIGRDKLLAFIRGCLVEKRPDDAGTEERTKPRAAAGYGYKRLDLRPKHACGATTKAGSPCTRMTRDKRCPSCVIPSLLGDPLRIGMGSHAASKRPTTGPKFMRFA